MSDEQLASMLQNNINENSRCLYENDDILVQHSVVTFPSGDKEAVLMVSQKKDGLIWRTETGATSVNFNRSTIVITPVGKVCPPLN